MFTTYFNKLKTLNFLPSYFHKNRFWIERDMQKKKIFFLWTFTKRTERWVNYERENLTWKFLSFQYNWIAYLLIVIFIFCTHHIYITNNININFFAYLLWLASDFMNYLTLYMIWIAYFFINNLFLNNLNLKSINQLPETSLRPYYLLINTSIHTYPTLDIIHFYKKYFFFLWLQSYANFLPNWSHRPPFVITTYAHNLNNYPLFLSYYQFNSINYSYSYNAYANFQNNNIFNINNRLYLNFIKTNYWKKTLNFDSTALLTYWTSTLQLKNKTIFNTTADMFYVHNLLSHSSHWIALRWISQQAVLAKMKISSLSCFTRLNPITINNTYRVPAIYNYSYIDLFNNTWSQLANHILKSTFYKQPPVFISSKSPTRLY